MFICRITEELMHDPVLLSSGFSYEREAIMKHFSYNGWNDPVTRENVRQDVIVENRNLKKAIENFLKQNPWAYNHMPASN